MSRYLNPTNDVSFRKLFGTEKHKPLLISFLNSVLALEGERRIKRVEFLSKDQAPLIQQTKTSILDIKCTDERNVQYIVEMQNKSVPAFIKRTQFYVAHSYVTQFPAGSDYIELKPVILLAIANYELFPSKEKAISYHKTLDVDTLENDLKDLSYVFIELPKFNKQENSLETIQDKWLYFFKNWQDTKEVPSKVREEELLEAYRSMEEYNWNASEREAYIKANMALTDEYDARRKEREEGKQEGKEEERLEVAKKMLKQGFSVEQVNQVTELPAKIIQGFIDSEV
jgi:predicted transposase/invertase (TIGR01784 family)